MTELLEKYGSLLREVDGWFRKCSERYPDYIRCHSGCSSCCRGLFDITLLDAIYLKQGFDLLPAPKRQEIELAANRRLEALAQKFPGFVSPWILNVIPEPEWENLMPEDDETPCLLLSDTGQCLNYEYRPMTCRLNGIPLIDLSGEELFDDWCTLNFVNKNPRRLRGLRHGFLELFAQELLLFHELTRSLTGEKIREVDLFIPAAVVLDMNSIVPVLNKMVVWRPTS